jgi:hypothetical protein
VVFAQDFTVSQDFAFVLLIDFRSVGLNWLWGRGMNVYSNCAGSI